MAAVWVRRAVTGKVYPALLPPGASVRDLLLVTEAGIPLCDFYVKCNGRLVGSEEELQDGLTYSLEPRMCGGKGGFGSMLRALGAQIEKTTNREACRDLSGRRLRDVNHEKAMAEWTQKQAEREAEKEQRRLERLQRKLAEPKHYFTNPEYQQQCHEMSERLEESVIKGIQASSSTMVSPVAPDSRKRKKELENNQAKSGKKKCFWTGVEGLEDSSSSDDGNDSDTESPCSSALSGASYEGIAPRLQNPESASDSDGSEPLPTPSETSENPQEQNSAGKLPQRTPEEEPQISDAVQKSDDAEDKVSENAELETRVLEAETRNTDPSPPPDLSLQDHPPPPDLSLQDHHPFPDPFLQDSPPPDPSLQDPTPPPDPSLQDPTPPDPSLQDHPPPPPDPSLQDHPPLDISLQDHPPPPLDLSLQDSSPPLDLMAFDSAAAMEATGLEKLKVELMALGLKCGGTLQERAARLFSVRGLSRDKIDPALFAKPAKGRKKK
ncbi:hypothetical protein FKM82_010154 [Ascaphus truei]